MPEERRIATSAASSTTMLAAIANGDVPPLREMPSRAIVMWPNGVGKPKRKPLPTRPVAGASRLPPARVSELPETRRPSRSDRQAPSRSARVRAVDAVPEPGLRARAGT